MSTALLSYPRTVAADEVLAWPAAGRALLADLAAGRGRPALLVGDSADVDRTVARVAVDLDLKVVRLGRALADLDSAPSETDVRTAVGDATLIADIELLLSASFGVAALPLLADLARRRPTIAVWPGHVAGNRATYAVPGHPDHLDTALSDVIVLRAHRTRFDDEAPFTIERIAP